MSLKLFACLLYVVRVAFDRGPSYVSCKECRDANKTDSDGFYDLNWQAIIWVDKSQNLWLFQTFVAMICLTEAVIFVYLRFKGNFYRSLFSLQFLAEISMNLPFIPTIFVSSIRTVFIPSFLNCWLAKRALEYMFCDLNRVNQRHQSALSHRLAIMSATVLCLIFTSACGIQHFQRAGGREMNLFQSVYFVVVTFSTVGYGDFVPGNMLSQLYIMIMICVAFIVLPTQVELLVYTWMEKQKMGRNYRINRANNEKHVVVCSTTLNDNTVLDFLHEFYAHPMLQDVYTVLLSPCELDATTNMILQVPLWAHRVIYIKGSVLNDDDLVRARQDEHNVLRSWAIRDFAPDVPQLVQIFRTKNKMHVAFAEQVVCEDELKYAILANNCLCPGTSTLISLLIHTSRGEEGQSSEEEWQRLYGKGSGNEVYHIRLRESRFFSQYEGKSFTYASFNAHKRYGIALIGIQTTIHSSWPILLNPGPSYILKASDTCFYLSLTEEQNSALSFTKETRKPSFFGREHMHTPDFPNYDVDEYAHARLTESTPDLRPSNESDKNQAQNYTSDIEIKTGIYKKSTSNQLSTKSKFLTIPRVPEKISETNIIHKKYSTATRKESWKISGEEAKVVKGYPPVLPYIGVTPTRCYILQQKKPSCCLQLTKPCEHCEYKSAYEYKWSNKCIILAADQAADGIYNFLIPLRAHFHDVYSLCPVVLLLEQPPNQAFIDVLSWLPLVYWSQGTIGSLDDILHAGINFAECVVVINKESINSMYSIYLADCSTIVDVQTIFKMFPNIRIMTELRQTSNMRFMQFRAYDNYALSLSKTEKLEKKRGSHMSYIFRIPFAGGAVFSASMLDTLLYQAFVKDYVISILRLLLGIDQAPGSGFLSSYQIRKHDLWINTYGRLYQKLCAETHDIPIGIYRTQKCPTTLCNSLNMNLDDQEFLMQYQQLSADIEREEISNLVRNRMRDLGLPVQDYDKAPKPDDRLSYVIINPSKDLKLEEGDIVYIIRAAPMEPAPNTSKGFKNF
ncbi:potassium channel subfamily T member 2-like isoform X6 [Dinothrombium tinctorium]|uniref:Potassium channel subfamily T member 2-like isoform X6 n=1 Tax=Dinothrombium tinctorium TaxID=1965070 RepID=A0A3S3P631_9ACAR|nr:potassium channel subfamily T member 2-like isoform X6 [Dinothrombium tinctorium]RWS14239.1 potassium channel subfamily T member 2-like isoform X6 [Dinothrombium tinctorium]RWS15698.1 potassium channel subfamily T member 2-like isoform X6 [Dinothrombium tinctorium]